MSRNVVASRIAGGSVYEIDTATARLDIAAIHRYLSVESHWARGIAIATVQRAIEHSLAFGLYRDDAPVGFARVVTDHATFAYLADVFVLPGERNAGLGGWLVRTILAHPPLQGLRRWLLGTRDAQRLYRRCGFADPPAGFDFLERLDAEIYAGALSPRRQSRRRPG